METIDLGEAVASLGPNGWVISAPRISGRMVSDFVEAVASRGGGRCEIWIEDAPAERADSGPDHATLVGAGFSAYRDLHQLRVPLPLAADEAIVETRPYRSSDLGAFLEVNNRAFAWHPEQSGLTPDDVATRQAEPWYDADGFRLYDIGDRLAGFCWTKIHNDTRPALGEIYAIAVDPDFHGRGLGRKLTAAGLDWLANQGLAVGILYVESDNEAAQTTYARLGFELYQVNRAYELEVEATT